MQMQLTKKIGSQNYVFTVDGNNLFELVQKSQHFGFGDVTNCGLCGSENLSLRSYVTEKEHFEYTKIVCADCRGSVTFGKAKKDLSAYLRKTEDGKVAWEAYTPKTEQK